ncbi:unnamed protein product [Urochloa decumbens]|uniref:BHLH domain-containing protein n=1 Tax=Urochloa decumbens TaxID=240449 RepID=A0ABC9ECP9_9POAL
MPRPAPASHRPAAAALVSSSSTSPVATMWEYQQAAALQTASSSASSFPSWSSYAAGSAFATDAEDGHAWTQHGQQGNNTTCYRENFLDLLASKNVTQEMFEEDHYATQALSAGRLGVGAIAAPIKHEATGGSPLFFGSATTPPGNGMHQGMNMQAANCTPCYPYADHHHHQVKAGSNHHQQQLPTMASFLQQLNSNASVGMHASLDYSGIGLEKICQEAGRATEGNSFGMRSLPDLSSFSGYRSSNAESTSSAQPYLRSADLSDSRKQEQDINVSARSSSTGSGAASDRKKRSSEERTSTVKKSKQQEGSKASPPKPQVPKVKIGEKITALQQIVSPFGKTDTASVLFETIKYIKFLHEQVQLLSEPYTNSSRNKGNNLPWVVVEHAAETTSKQGGDGAAEHDLRDRGLCLVPVSWTPQVYRDGTAMDYWTPAYRGCLYR